MIKFFRKIRKSMLSEGKTRHYLLYAIGEIVLVVIGILIALQINIWSQARKDNRALKEYLIKVKSHTMHDLRKLEEITQGRTFIGNQCKEARGHILNKTVDENLALFMSCGTAFADFYFKPRTSGYEALKNSAYFGKINNTTLDSLLTEYHNLVDDIAENEKSYNDYVLAQEAQLAKEFDMSLILASAIMPPDSIAKNFSTTQIEIYDVFREYTATIPYRNVINLAAFQFDLMIPQYGQLKLLGQNVIKEIDKITAE